jgi:hypothetical protein
VARVTVPPAAVGVKVDHDVENYERGSVHGTRCACGWWWETGTADALDRMVASHLRTMATGRRQPPTGRKRW